MQNPTIGIIGGKGRMGGLFASFFKEHGMKVLIADIGTKLTNIELAQKSDITIVSVPIDQTLKVIQEILPHLPKTSAFMDFTSVKVPPVNAMLKGKCEVMGMHPMFAHSNPIPGQVIILTPTRKSGRHSQWMEQFLRDHGSTIYKMSPKEHDKIMASAQSVIHFADIAFADTLRRQKIPIKELFKYTSKSSEFKVMLAARLIDQSPNLYGNIQIQNPYNLSALKNYQKSVDELLKIVRKKDLKNFTNYFLKSRKFLGKYAHEAFDESTYLMQIEIDKSRKSETHPKPKKSDLALLGPRNTFSDLAAAKISMPKYYAKGIDQVFQLVEKGSVAQGLVPIENSCHGTVRETVDALFTHDVHITGEIKLPIHHCLITHKSARKSQIKAIISHSQALSQCKKYLDKHFPKAEIQASTSTATALTKLTDQSIAIIAPSQAATGHKILAKNIEDQKDNTTTFILINSGNWSRDQKNLHGQKNKTSIAFHFSKDSAGSLFTVFKEFKEAKMNMTKIESRPTKAQFGQYIFYLDFSGHISQPNTQKLLARVTTHVAKLKILGSY